MPDIFIEQLGNLVVGAGVIRLDFMRIEPGASANTSQPQPGLRVVIPLPAFAQALDAMNTLRDQLVADGVLARTQTDAVPFLKN